MSKWISKQMISESPVQAVLTRRKRDLEQIKLDRQPGTWQWEAANANQIGFGLYLLSKWMALRCGLRQSELGCLCCGCLMDAFERMKPDSWRSVSMLYSIQGESWWWSDLRRYSNVINVLWRDYLQNLEAHWIEKKKGDIWSRIIVSKILYRVEIYVRHYLWTLCSSTPHSYVEALM